MNKLKSSTPTLQTVAEYGAAGRESTEWGVMLGTIKALSPYWLMLKVGGGQFDKVQYEPVITPNIAHSSSGYSLRVMDG